MPTLGQRSRNPVQAPDGTIWRAGQWGRLIGKIDPVTRAMKDYPPPRGAMPHSVLLNARGNVCYTGNKSGLVGYLDPKTEEITVFEMPEPAARDPHTTIFDAEGILCFTLQHSSMIGRLDPATGDIEEWPSPSGPKSHPYAIAVIDGIVWYNESGVRPDPLVRFDPATETFQSWPIPSGGVHAGIIRHMRPTADGRNLLIHQSSTNRIILVNLQGAAPTQ